MVDQQKKESFLAIILEALENQVSILKQKQLNDPDAKFEITTNHTIVEVQYVLSLLHLLKKIGPDMNNLMETLKAKTIPPKS